MQAPRPGGFVIQGLELPSSPSTGGPVGILNPFLPPVVRRSTMELAAYESRTPVNDTQLITRVVAGDATAERELYETFVDRIYRLAFRIAGDNELAQDFTQSTFIRAFEKIGSFRGHSPERKPLRRFAFHLHAPLL